MALWLSDNLRISKIPKSEVVDLVFLLGETTNNPRYNAHQFSKYWFQDGVTWYGLFEGSRCLALAVVALNNMNNKSDGRDYVAMLLELQCITKGFGRILLNKLIEQLKNVYWQVNPNSKKTLFEYYKKVVPNGTEIVEKNSVKYFICGENEDVLNRIKSSL